MYHTHDYLTANDARIRGVMQGRTWIWTGIGEGDGGVWDGSETFVQFAPPFTWLSQLYWRTAP